MNKISLLFIIVTTITYILSPFFGVLLILFIIHHTKESKSVELYYSFLIALFWGLLAYTQDSKADIGTDAIRYYDMFTGITNNISSLNDLLILFNKELVTFIFIPVTTAIVFLAGNVQIISLFWVTITYFFFFVSLRKILHYEGVIGTRSYAKWLTLIMTCVMLFVQISETMKNASAFAIAFYGLTILYTSRNWVRCLLWLIVAVGIHPSSVAFLPLFFYKNINSKFLIYTAYILFFISPFIDIFEIISSILPQTGYWGVIQQLAEGYISSEHSSRRYILLLFVLLATTHYAYYSDPNKTNKNICNIIFIYCIVSILNVTNIHSFVRFVNFMHPFVFLSCVALFKQPNPHKKIIMCCFLSFMLFFTLRLTIARTITGGYLSTYMDNSIVNIMASNIFDYLKFTTY